MTKYCRVVMLSVFLVVFCGSQFGFGDDFVSNSAAGKRLSQLLSIINNSDEEKTNKFLSSGFQENDEATLKRRRQQTAQVKSQLGKLTVSKIVRDSDNEIVANCTSESGPEIVLTITVGSESPHLIESVGLEMGQSAPADEKPLDGDLRSKTIETLANQLRSKYVFPKVGESMATSVEDSFDAGEYDDINDADQFAKKLTKQLRDICNDKHLRVRAGGPRRPGNQTGRKRTDNHGFVKAEVLPGGIGYLKFNYFAGDESAKETAAAAMKFLSNSNALIFDLRENGGGSPEMIAFLTSFFYEEPVHLNSFYNRPTDTTTESWTSKEIPGERFADSTPIYVLTSSYTFSGAEEFSYNLKNLKRATIVGETTGGGAHPVMMLPLGKQLSMSMPFARAINPITKTNWEGVGVKPHVEIAADEAMDKAVELAGKAIAKISVAKNTQNKTKHAGSGSRQKPVIDFASKMNAANQLMANQEFDEAAKLYKKLTKLAPDNGNAWFRLGYCLHGAGQLDAAIKVHKKAAEFEQFSAIATYNLGCALSLQGKIDEAFAALEKSVDLGMNDVSQFEQDTDLDNLREDERFDVLLKKIDELRLAL